MRTVVLSLLLLCCALLPAVGSSRFVEADSVAILAMAQLPADRSVFLEINAEDWTPVLTDRLKTRLLAGGYLLLTRDASDGVTLSVGCSSEAVPRKGPLDVSRSRLHHRFTLQVTDNATGQILSYQTRDYIEIVSDNDSDHLRWYDPVLVTAVVGGLVYLFYFGAK